MAVRNNVRLALIFMSSVFLLSVISDRLISVRLPKFNMYHEAKVTEFNDAQSLMINNDGAVRPSDHDHNHNHNHNNDGTSYLHQHQHQPPPEASSGDDDGNNDSNARSKIGKMSMLYGEPSPLYERAIAAHKPHNERFGYPFFVLREQTLPGYWSKPAYILQILLTELSKPSHQRLEWLFWVDVDTVLMNPKIPLEIFLPPTPTSQDNNNNNNNNNWTHIHTLVTNDHRGLNNGVFFLRVHPRSVDLITATLSTPYTFPNLHLEFGDQTALQHWLNQPQFRQHTMHVPQRWFNAYAGWRGPSQPSSADTKDLFADPLQPPTPGKQKPNSIKEGDLLVHHAGHKSLRLQRMKPWMDVAERHLDTWELDLEQTTYQREIKEFWDKEARNEWRNVDKMNKQMEEMRRKKMAKDKGKG